jgi:short-subunit dehydrogenase
MQSIIITGAGTGLGKELALKYADLGFHIILAGRREAALQEAKEAISSHGGKADTLTLDISKPAEVREKAAKLAEQFDLFGLINNAGVGHFGPFENLKEEELHDMLSVNLMGTVYMAHALLPTIKEKKGSFLMNIISTAGLRGKANEAAYCASKFAARGFTESLQKEYENDPVLIQAVYMGGMDTPFWDHNNYISDRSRLRSPAEVAGIIAENRFEEKIVIESGK